MAIDCRVLRTGKGMPQFQLADFYQSWEAALLGDVPVCKNVVVVTSDCFRSVPYLLYET